jgi:hypothetical protein
MEALERVLDASWQELARYATVAEAAGAELGHETMRTAHEPAIALVAALVERGRRDGTFRVDLPSGWIVASIFSLIHLARAEVQAGRLKPTAAEAALRTSIRDLVAA